MRTIKSKGTKTEVLLGKALWAKGIRYRKHYRVRGRPDFALVKNRILIFVDGDFWHGNGWRLRGFKKLEDSIKHNKKFWIKKIKTNMLRDKLINKVLRKEGWKIIRFWESKIYKDVNKCVTKIEKCLP